MQLLVEFNKPTSDDKPGVLAEGSPEAIFAFHARARSVWRHRGPGHATRKVDGFHTILMRHGAVVGLMMVEAIPVDTPKKGAPA
ncbi:MAG: hypothetical protein KA761_00375 [Gemmatimonadaceae bacterium]|nr:hypothetical protein [Gemmatimonadaceae bacterium]